MPKSKPKPFSEFEQRYSIKQIDLIMKKIKRMDDILIECIKIKTLMNDADATVVMVGWLTLNHLLKQLNEQRKHIDMLIDIPVA